MTSGGQSMHKYKLFLCPIESEIYSQIYGRHLSLVGWYRSCPGMPPLPSLKDSEAQLEYQMKLLGNSDSTYSPCVGIITSPFTR